MDVWNISSKGTWRTWTDWRSLWFAVWGAADAFACWIRRFHNFLRNKKPIINLFNWWLFRNSLCMTFLLYLLSNLLHRLCFNRFRLFVHLELSRLLNCRLHIIVIRVINFLFLILLLVFHFFSSCRQHSLSILLHHNLVHHLLLYLLFHLGIHHGIAAF